jgi:hypothetical protein
MLNYEIHLFKADGTLSILMSTVATGDVDAKLRAVGMLKGGITSAEVWRGLDMIGAVKLPP